MPDSAKTNFSFGWRSRVPKVNRLTKGSKKAVITKIQPVSIHGQVSLDIYFLDPDDQQGQTSRARVGQESVPRSLEAGDTVELHYVLGVVTHITKA